MESAKNAGTLEAARCLENHDVEIVKILNYHGKPSPRSEHYARLVCSECGYIGWLNKAQVDTLEGK